MKKLLLILVILFAVGFGQSASAATLRIGMKGSTEVMVLQQNLKTLGFYEGSVDGNFGPRTQMAVVRFQQDNKLSADGIVGPKTNKIVADRVSIGSISTVTASDWETICADGKPHAQVISPNGNESYMAGQNIDVSWKSCNVAKDVEGSIMLTYKKPSGGVWGQALITNSGNFGTVNDGMETVKLLTADQIIFSGGSFDKRYYIQVTFDVSNPSIGNKFSDGSNDSFTINK